MEQIGQTPEEDAQKKDLTLRIALISIAALTLIAAVVFYVGKYTQPEKGRVSLFDSIFTQNTQQPVSTTTAADILNVQNQQRIENGVKASMSSSSTSSTSTTANNTVTLDSNTFAPIAKYKSKGTPVSPKNIITEYVIRATSSSAYSTTTRVDTLSTTTTSSSLGITYKVDPFWVIAKKGSSNMPVVIIKKVGPKAADVITMTRFQGTSAGTEDPTYGNVSYYYDNSSGQWMSVHYSDSAASNTSVEPEPVTLSQFTVGNKPIFRGTSATKTLIVALNTNDFIIVNISGTGYSDILNDFVKNIQ